MRRHTGLVVIVALATAATTVSAQDVSLNRPGSGARAAGMGNAFIAVSDDGTAASWNPAGLAQLREAEFSLVHSTVRRNGYREGFRTRDQSAAYTSISTVSTTADIEFASAAVPFRIGGKPVTLQIGWRRLYELGTNCVETCGECRSCRRAAGGASASTPAATEVSTCGRWRELWVSPTACRQGGAWTSIGVDGRSDQTLARTRTTRTHRFLVGGGLSSAHRPCREPRASACLPIGERGPRLSRTTAG